MYLTFKKTLLCSALAATALFTACNKEDDNNNNGEDLNDPVVEGAPSVAATDNKISEGLFFLAVDGSEKQFILKTDNLGAGAVPITDNSAEVPNGSPRWLFANGVAFGVDYSGAKTIGASYCDADGKEVKKLGETNVTSGQNSIGQTDATALVMMGQRPISGVQSSTWGFSINAVDFGATGATLRTNFINTREDAVLKPWVDASKNQQATFVSGLGMGNGTFLSSMIVSKPRTGGGNWSTGIVDDPNRVWVAYFDKDLKVRKVITDTRISYSAARTRAWYYPQIAKAENGDVYVFSGSHEDSKPNEKDWDETKNKTTLPAGVLRIKAGTEEFDKAYYFNVQEKSENYKFHQVFSAGGTKFFVEFYNRPSLPTPLTFDEKRNFNFYNRFAFVDVEAKTVTWVQGLPALDKIVSHGVPLYHNGKIYLPLLRKGKAPAIYVIDPATAKAARGLEITGAKEISAIGVITKK